ncbi:DUF4013 domain-containing protein [Oscillochloris sp. ZM17-4]|uniref:DUF4013 domain-containing protein n=1 Tax=Oscillochloris sp. ZM17-4 TaxID=2866714 RepID=UPI001C737ECF|nr:DUF4013 domain-containing protein [Oscillochloris sp. ZM17-4]MBX0330394.1 DUF4013 domain-containing protein [Oscillochloris sp. ZM17-4]
MDIGRAFSYVLEDEEWLTVILLGGLILIVPIFGQIVLVGFVLEAARNVAAGQSRPLPKWNHLGETFGLGLPGIAIQIVYALPLILLSVAFMCLGLLGSSLLAAADSASGPGGLILAAIFCLIPLTIVLSLIIQPLTIAATVRYLQTGSLGGALQVGEAVRMVRSDLGGWLVLWLLQILCGIVGGIGGVFLGFGALFTTVYGQAVFGHLLGQTLARAMATASDGPLPPPMSPPSPLSF